MIYNKENLSSDNIKNSFDILFDISNLNYINQKHFIKIKNGKTLKLCPFCKLLRSKSLIEHLLTNCDIVNKKCNKKLWIGNCMNTQEQNKMNKIKFINQIHEMRKEIM